MSRTTENVYVRGTHTKRVVAAVEKRLRSQGFARVAESADFRIVLRREGAWTIIADPRGFGSFGQPADGDLDGWGRDLSRDLDRSVLTIWTWDGESSVIATRWKRGVMRGRIELLKDAMRGADGKARAPAKFLWPWLPKKDRDAILRDGLPLVAPASATGDAELDDLLAGFDDDDLALEDDGDDDLVYVDLDTSVRAIGAAVGLKNPMLNPHDDEDGRELFFEREPLSS